MTVHITWPGLLVVIGGTAVLWFLIRLLYLLWIVWRWGK